MIRVHHLATSQSERIVWLCEELGLPYELVLHARDPATRAGAPAIKALTPFGTAPVIEDGDLVLGESGAIIEYLCRKYADSRLILGPEHPDFASYLFWFHFGNGSLLPGVMMDLVAQRFGAPKEPPPGAPPSRTDRGYAMIEQRLSEAPFLAGEEFTAADVMNVFALTTMRDFAPRDLAPYPNITAYLGRIGERPAYRWAMARAEPARAPGFALPLPANHGDPT